MSSDASTSYPELASAAATVLPEASYSSRTSSTIGVNTLQPLPSVRMMEIVTEACDQTFEKVESYDHPQTRAWNTSIIDKTLQALIAASSKTSPFKFAVTSTIIEHNTPSQPTIDSNNDTKSGDIRPRERPIARRGMHSATGAYWDSTRDGCWSFKYEKGEAKGFDVVVSVIWISVE